VSRKTFPTADPSLPRDDKGRVLQREGLAEENRRSRLRSVENRDNEGGVVTKGRAVSKGRAATLGLWDWDRRTADPLRSPGFPVEIGGVGEFYAPFLKEKGAHAAVSSVAWQEIRVGMTNRKGWWVRGERLLTDTFSSS
jgi:hypothetical protein